MSYFPELKLKESGITRAAGPDVSGLLSSKEGRSLKEFRNDNEVVCVLCRLCKYITAPWKNSDSLTEGL